MRKGLLALALTVALPSLSSAALPETTAPGRDVALLVQHRLPGVTMQVDNSSRSLVLAKVTKKKNSSKKPPPPRRRPKVSPHK